MKFSHSFGASAALLLAPAVLAQPTEPSPTATNAAPSCTASLIATICDYKEPGPEFAVASSGRDHCLEYCNEHQPCNFVIFRLGNPYTGVGTCWLYPDESFDPSLGSEACGDLSLQVYGKPTCAGTPTEPSGCAATASPSAVAAVCDYPPPGDCINSCSASLSASNCLRQCAESDECAFVVFNPHNPSNSPHASGSCWMYPDGKYDPEAAGTCGGDAPEQYVYNNTCPRPPRVSPSASRSPSRSTAAVSDSESPSRTGDSDNSEPSRTGGPATSENSSDDGDDDSTNVSNDSVSEDSVSEDSVSEDSDTDGNGGSGRRGRNSAPATPLSLTVPLAVGLTVVFWQGFA
ncbi:hypothetical protein B0I35DRAFT_434204 [Stachybotrys elegans]|uniref:Apple domain-containing protein n=1 Tax=Stachybotrys elegans TaxID=80388 RepID=A0A8K0WQK2_9HYPO|nr:hypothetical protein B0I35DRAFT_434204 [Stachybotrys elegans]